MPCLELSLDFNQSPKRVQDMSVHVFDSVLSFLCNLSPSHVVSLNHASITSGPSKQNRLLSDFPVFTLILLQLVFHSRAKVRFLFLFFNETHVI